MNPDQHAIEVLTQKLRAAERERDDLRRQLNVAESERDELAQKLSGKWSEREVDARIMGDDGAWLVREGLKGVSKERDQLQVDRLNRQVAAMRALLHAAVDALSNG